MLDSLCNRVLTDLSVKLYFSNLGGQHSFLFWLLCVTGFGLSEASNTIQSWWLGYWASQYDPPNDPSNVAVP